MTTPDLQASSVELIEIVENQLTESEPIQVKETLMRLMMTGETREDAVEFIACALSVEILAVVNQGQSFNEKRYVKNLSALPNLSFIEK